MNSITIILLFICLLSFCAFCGESDLEWPEITNQTRPWSRWWWLGNILDKDGLSIEMEKYRKAGLGGLEITPIYGVKGYENRFIDYLSPRWMEMLDHTLREASRLGLGIDMATGTGWPFGGPWIDADDACKTLIHQTYNLKGGESLSEPIVYLQKPLVHAIGHRVAISELKEPLSTNRNLSGKKLASSESATWLNEHFVSTLGDVKQAVDRFFLGGVNHIFYHGTPYSPASEEWPGRLFYASVHFGTTNSFWNDFPALNNYVARCQSFLQSGRPDNDVLLYYPIHDSWSQPGKNLLIHYGQGIEGAMSQSAGVEMLQKGYTYDLISDRQLGQVEIKGGSLYTGGNSYKVIVLPECGFIPLRTFERLIELAGKGATIIVQNNLPADVSGWGNLAERRNRFKSLVSSLRLTLVSGDVQSAKVGNGRLLLGKDLERLLAFAGGKREKLVDQGLQFVRRKYEKGRYYFVINSGKETFEGWIPLETEARAAAIFNPMREEKGMAAQRRKESGAIEVYLQLSAGESCILKTFTETVTGPRYGYFQAKGEPARVSGAWSVKFIEGGPELPASLETRDLGSWTEFGGEAVKKFSGTARYTISFEKPKEAADGWLLDLGRVCESARISLNGKALGTLINSPYRIRIPVELLKEKNTIEIDVSNLMANRIADLDRRQVNWKKFYNVNFPARRPENRGPDGLFNAANWVPRDSGLIGPVTITPLRAVRTN